MATYGQLISFGPRFSGGRLCTLKVYHYITGTTTLKDVYTDRDKTTTAAQPAVSNSDGMVHVYADGLYKFRVDGSTDGVTYTTLDTIDKWAVVDQSLTFSGEGDAIASAATLVLGSDGDFFHVTGSTGPIGIISGSQARVTLVFDSTPTLTHSGTLILQNNANYTAVAGDVFVFVFEGGSVWREESRRLAVSSIITKRKTADESVTSSTTLQDDDHLTFSIAANEEWVGELHASAINTSVVGIKMAFTCPAGGTILYMFDIAGNAGNVHYGGQSVISGVAVDATPALMTGANSGSISAHVWVLNSTTAGSVTFQWAQSTSGGTAMTIRKGSSLTATRIA